MALVTTLEMDGTKTIPAPNEIGKIYEHEFVINTVAATGGTPLGIGDFVQLGYKPAEAVIVEASIGEDSAVGVGATVVELGYADALVTTTISTTLVAAAVPDNTVAMTQVFEDAAIEAPKDDEDTGLLALEITTEAEIAGVIFVRIRYRAA